MNCPILHLPLDIHISLGLVFSEKLNIPYQYSIAFDNDSVHLQTVKLW